MYICPNISWAIYLSILTIGISVGLKRESTGEEGDGGGDQIDKGGQADHSWDYDDGDDRWWWWRWRRWWLWWSMFQHQKDVQSWLEARWQTMYTCSREETDLKRGRFDSLALLQQLQLDNPLNLKCALVNWLNCEYLSFSTDSDWSSIFARWKHVKTWF